MTFHYVMAALLLAAPVAQDANPKLLAAAKADGLSAEETEIAVALDAAHKQSATANGFKPYRDTLVGFYKRKATDEHKMLVQGAACWHARWSAKDSMPELAPAKFVWGWIKPVNPKRCPE